MTKWVAKRKLNETYRSFEMRRLSETVRRARRNVKFIFGSLYILYNHNWVKLFKNSYYIFLLSRHDLRCAIASCKLRCAVASCDVRVRTHFGCKLRCACVRCFLRCAKCDRNFARFLVYITLLWVENR